MINMTDEQILTELKNREPIFHREQFGRKRHDFEAMMDKGFWEVGASGNIYTKDHVLDTLEERYSKSYEETWQNPRDFKCRQLSEDIFLLTYTLTQDNTRITRRSTIWKFYDGNWKIMYHQGTVVVC